MQTRDGNAWPHTHTRARPMPACTHVRHAGRQASWQTGRRAYRQAVGKQAVGKPARWHASLQARRHASAHRIVLNTVPQARHDKVGPDLVDVLALPLVGHDVPPLAAGHEAVPLEALEGQGDREAMRPHHRDDELLSLHMVRRVTLVKRSSL